MQTFLPYADFAESARCLDDKRLGKQLVEVLQILNAILNPTAKGWRNHPATNMWRGHELALIRYGVAICDEWRARGFRDTVREKLLARACEAPNAQEPSWLGIEALHSSHRANLLRKDLEFYRRHGWTENPETPYYWPAQLTPATAGS